MHTGSLIGSTPVVPNVSFLCIDERPNKRLQRFGVLFTSMLHLQGSRMVTLNKSLFCAAAVGELEGLLTWTPEETRLNRSVH